MLSTRKVSVLEGIGIREWFYHSIFPRSNVGGRGRTRESYNSKLTCEWTVESKPIICWTVERCIIIKIGAKMSQKSLLAADWHIIIDLAHFRAIGTDGTSLLKITLKIGFPMECFNKNHLKMASFKSLYVLYFSDFLEELSSSFLRTNSKLKSVGLLFLI